jgi:hypothetical protein
VCPLCMATLALTVAGVVSTGGAAAIALKKNLFNGVVPVGLIAAVRGCDDSHPRKQ